MTVLEECLSEVTEILFEPSFDRSHTLPVVGLVFGRMSSALKAKIGMLKTSFEKERMLVYFRPFAEGGVGVSFIVRESLLVVNSATLRYDARAFQGFADQMERGEPFILTCYQRDRNDRLRFVTDTRYEPYFFPARYFHTASMLLEG